MNRRLFLSLLAGAAAGRRTLDPRRTIVMVPRQHSMSNVLAWREGGHTFYQVPPLPAEVLEWQRWMDRVNSELMGLVSLSPKAPWVQS